MYKNFLLLLGAVSALVSCGKEKPQNPESVFYLGNTAVRTRDFKGYCINGKTELRFARSISSGKYLSLQLGFNYSTFPNHDSLLVSYSGHSFNQRNIGFHLDTTQYLVDQNNNTYIQAISLSNGKAKYILQPTWFYSQYPDPTYTYFIKGNDSILVQGTFYEPNDVVIR